MHFCCCCGVIDVLCFWNRCSFCGWRTHDVAGVLLLFLASLLWLAPFCSLSMLLRSALLLKRSFFLLLACTCCCWLLSLLLLASLLEWSSFRCWNPCSCLRSSSNGVWCCSCCCWRSCSYCHSFCCWCPWCSLFLLSISQQMLISKMVLAFLLLLQSSYLLLVVHLLWLAFCCGWSQYFYWRSCSFRCPCYFLACVPAIGGVLVGSDITHC